MNKIKINELNTVNSNSLEYTTDILTLTVLGGIRLLGMDKLRVTLKVELKDPEGLGTGIRPPVRHNLDLYNDNQLEKFIRKVAERLEIGTRIVEEALSELTNKLENYRIEELKKESAAEIEIPVLSDKAKKEAEHF